MGRRRVGPEDIIAINEAYLEIGTYAGAGRATGWSGSTVKRYIIPDYVPQSEVEQVEYDEITIPEEYLEIAPEWQELLDLTVEEEEKIKELEPIIGI